MVARYITCKGCGQQRRQYEDGYCKECFEKKEKPIMLSDVKRIVLNDGDIIVIRCKKILTEQAIKNIRDVVERTILGHKVIILEEDMDIGVIGK